MRPSPTPVDVTLQRWQVAYALEEANFRHEWAQRHGARHGSTDTIGLDSQSAHVIGALCELAVAWHLKREERFFAEDPIGKADVSLVEVRGSRKPDAHLRVYESDVKKAEFMVLAIVREAEEAGAVIRLMGWTWTEHAWRYSKPAPFPPHPKRGPARLASPASLHPMRSIRQHLEFMEAW